MAVSCGTVLWEGGAARVQDRWRHRTEGLHGGHVVVIGSGVARWSGARARALGLFHTRATSECGKLWTIAVTSSDLAENW